MYGKFQEHLQQELKDIKDAGLYKEERLIEGPQQAAIQVKGKEVLNFCANNYLGLSNNPRLIKAAKDMMDRRGTACRACALFAVHRTCTRSLRLPSQSSSRLRTPFFTLLASTPTAVCLSHCSLPTMPSFRTR